MQQHLRRWPQRKQQPQRRKLRAAYRKAERLHQPKAEKELQWQKDKDHQPPREEQQPPREDQQFYRQPSRLHQRKAEKELQWQKDKDHQPPREEQQCHKQPPSRNLSSSSLSSLRVQQELARFEHLVTEGSISDVQKMAGLTCLQWSCALTPPMAPAMMPPLPPPCPGAPLRPPCMTPAMTPVPPKVELPKKNVPQPTNLYNSFNWSKLPDAKLQVTVWSELGESELYNNMELESSRYGSNGRWSCPSRSTEVPATALGSSTRGGGRSGSSRPYDESGGRRTGRRRGCTSRRRRRSSCDRRRRSTSRRGRTSSSIGNRRGCTSGRRRRSSSGRRIRITSRRGRSSSATNNRLAEIYRHLSSHFITIISGAGPFRASCHRGQHIRCPEDGRSDVSAMELCPNATDGAGHDATITATLSGCTAPATVHDASNDSCATQSGAAKEERAAAHESIQQLQLVQAAGCQAPGHRLERAWRERAV
ncbi:uncharacterized protein LOC110182068 isoform X3 [Drosophila serrata]|uniref:uncharacterized protein LOC110182068 isoform X3 n=1 Tax=Drosophila serrata TaxID=7274 RepID=UPI000A1D3213|nr:uncharacterized protein LOC110182068 isoform X3 [Drosophila serrata]